MRVAGWGSFAGLYMKTKGDTISGAGEIETNKVDSSDSGTGILKTFAQT